MRAVKIIVGVLAGLFALAHAVYLPSLVSRGEPIASLMGSLAGLCIGAALSVACLRSAFAKPEPPTPDPLPTPK